MRYFLFSFWRGAIVPAFLLSLFFLPSMAFAVVGDVTLTGLPPNTTVSLTNEETKEKVEHKTDERGFVVIPMTGKSWQSGRHSVACQIDGKPVSSRIFLRDGVNRVDLTALTLAARPLDPANRQKVNETLKQSSATLKTDPKNSQALLTQGSALNRLGRHGMALASLAQATKLGSTHPALAFETGWSLMRLGMYPQAIAQLEKYEKTNPGLGHTSEFIGRSHLFMGELDKADAKFNEALKRDPKLASTTRFHQAILETLRKNPEAASNHIASLLKEAPNSPTAQIFKNATLQPKGMKPPAGAAGSDYKLSDPIKIQLPPTTAGDVAAGVAKGVVGGLLGGLFGGGGRQEPEGPNLVAKPSYPETMLTSKDGKTKINLSGALVDGKPYIVMGVQESPGNGAPHLILLQDKNCNVLQPKETSVTAIWEQWGAWKLTVNWTKSYYENGRLVKQEKGGWSTPWNEFKIQVKDPSELPGIWKDFNSKPFEGIREVMSTFDAPPGVPFNPADWNLITHATTDAGNNQIVTAPFVTGLGTDQNNNFIFKPMQQTMCESSPPSGPFVTGPTVPAQHPPGVMLPPGGAALLSPHTAPVQLPPGVILPPGGAPLITSETTLPWTVGPFGVTVTPTPDPKGAYKSEFLGGIEFEVARSVSLGVRYIHRSTPRVLKDVQPLPLFPDITGTAKPPEGAKTGERHPEDPAVTKRLPYPELFPFSPVIPEGAKIETRPDGTRVTTFADGVTVETRPDGTTITTYPDGIKIERRRDGRRTEIRPDGTATESWPDGTTADIAVRPDGTRTETRPDGTRIETHPNGTWVTTWPDGGRWEGGPDGTFIDSRPDGTRRATFPDGSAAEVRKDGSISFEDPPQTGQPPQPPAPGDTPGILDYIDEKIVIS